MTSPDVKAAVEIIREQLEAEIAIGEVHPQNVYAEALNALLADHARLSAEQGWRPIESAPRDGTLMLLWQSDDALCGYSPSTKESRRAVIGQFDGWWKIATVDLRAEGGGDKSYTHWRPLPSTPQSPAEEGQ